MDYYYSFSNALSTVSSNLLLKNYMEMQNHQKITCFVPRGHSLNCWRRAEIFSCLKDYLNWGWFISNIESPSSILCKFLVVASSLWLFALLYWHLVVTVVCDPYPPALNLAAFINFILIFISSTHCTITVRFSVLPLPSQWLLTYLCSKVLFSLCKNVHESIDFVFNYAELYLQETFKPLVNISPDARWAVVFTSDWLMVSFNNVPITKLEVGIFLLLFGSSLCL